MADPHRLARGSSARGSTLLEAIIAMAVLTIGALGSLSIYSTDVAMEGNSRKITRATAIAQDMVTQIQSWSWGDARLSNVHTENDAAVGDPGFALERSTDPLGDRLVDHSDAELDLTWTGLPSSAIPGYERYWTVDAGNDSSPDLQRVAVIVRWRVSSGGFKRVVMMVTKPNPAAVTR